MKNGGRVRGARARLLWEYNNPISTSGDDRLVLSALVWVERGRRRNEEECWGGKEQRKKDEKWKTAVPPPGRCNYIPEEKINVP